MSHNPADDTPKDKKATTEESPRVIRAEELFAGRAELWIELDGVRYRLRMTRRRKLILQK